MSQLHLDPRMPPADACVLRPLLERRARETPDKVYAWFEGGAPWTYREASRQAARTANALRALGVQRGDKVVSTGKFTSVNSIVVMPDGFAGAADPRTHGGLAVGY